MRQVRDAGAGRRARRRGARRRRGCGDDDARPRRAAGERSTRREGRARRSTRRAAPPARSPSAPGKDTTGGYARTPSSASTSATPTRACRPSCSSSPRAPTTSASRPSSAWRPARPSATSSRPTSSGSPSSPQQGWAMDLTDYVEGRADEFIPSTLAPNSYDGRYWGVPQVTGAGLLYRRTDQVAEPPATLAGALPRGGGRRRHVLPGRRVRGPDLQLPRDRVRRGRRRRCPRTGSRRRSTRRRTSRRWSSWSTGSKDGAAPKGVITYMEEPARRAFEAGRVTFMRNWSYAYALNQKAAEIRDRFEVTPLPPFEGGGRARHPRRQRPGPLGLLGEPGGRAAVHRPPHLGGDARGEHGRVLAPVGARGDLRRPGGAEGGPVRGRAQAGDRAGRAAAGLARLHADLAGDLRERQQGAGRLDEPGGRARAQGHEQIDEALATF